MITQTLATLVLAVAQTAAVQDILNGDSQEVQYFALSDERWDDSDLFHFETRTDVTPPKLDIIRYDREKSTPGYLFLAPYNVLNPMADLTAYVSHQAGPYIYDLDGELVWSGIEHFRDVSAHDFKLATIDGKDYLTMISFHGASSTPLHHGAFQILDSSYRRLKDFDPPVPDGLRNMHEFTLVNGSRNAVLCAKRKRPDEADPSRMIMEDLFLEVNIDTMQVLFEWSSLDHVSISESTANPIDEGAVDYFHMNSVEKLPSGDYIISARHTSTIYLISGRDGSIVWRLGGLHSSFEQGNFTFASQHNARVLSQNATTTVITFLDNATRDILGRDGASANISSILVVALHTAAKPMSATVLRRHYRPDGEYTAARGNAQTLPNGNMLAGWGDNAYITEHTEADEVVFEAIFMSSRFQNYRAYKFNFTGHPTDDPIVKASVQAAGDGSSNTVAHVSWNGATEVASWKFYTLREDGEERFLGIAPKRGFETAAVFSGYHKNVLAEAIDAAGRSLGNSSFETTQLPLGWHEGRSIPLFAKVPQMRNLQTDSSAVGFFAFLAGLLTMTLYHRVRSGRVAACAIGLIQYHRKQVLH